MELKWTDEFRRDALRIALSSGLMRKQVVDDPGVVMQTKNKLIAAERDTNAVSKEGLELHSRHATGWSVNNRMKRDLAIRALYVAITRISCL